MASPEAHGMLGEGSLPKKFKGKQKIPTSSSISAFHAFCKRFCPIAVNGSNGSPVKGDNGQSDVTYSEADSSNDLEIPGTAYGRTKHNGDSGVPVWGNEASPATPGSPGYQADCHEPSTSSGSRGEPLKEVLDSVEHQYVDEKTTKQMNDIENEVSKIDFFRSSNVRLG